MKRKIVGVVIVALLGYFFTVNTDAANIYTDALASGWSVRTWNATTDLTSTVYVYNGTHSLSTTYTNAWGSMELYSAEGINTSGLEMLTFFVHGGVTGGQEIYVALLAHV